MSQAKHDDRGLDSDHSLPFPISRKPGILFRDITPSLASGPEFKRSTRWPLHSQVSTMSFPSESRGFIFGAPMAYTLGVGTGARAQGRAIARRHAAGGIELGYGVNTVEIHSDAIKAGQRVIIVDDLLATGGTIRAAVNLVDRLDAELVGISVLVELADLKGREKLAGQNVRSLIV